MHSFMYLLLWFLYFCLIFIICLSEFEIGYSFIYCIFLKDRETFNDELIFTSLEKYILKWEPGKSIFKSMHCKKWGSSSSGVFGGKKLAGRVSQDKPTTQHCLQNKSKSPNPMFKMSQSPSTSQNEPEYSPRPKMHFPVAVLFGGSAAPLSGMPLPVTPPLTSLCLVSTCPPFSAEFECPVLHYFLHVDMLPHFKAFTKLHKTAIFNQCATRILKHAISDYLVRGTSLFSLRLSNKKRTTANTTIANSLNESKVYLFFVRSAKNIFLVCHRLLVVISLCVPWEEHSWKSLA